MQSILSFICIGCKDIANRKTCQKWLRNGKCSKDWAIKKCPKTCGNCSNDPCEDKMKSEKCQKLKNKGKCSKKWVAKKCPKTCHLCNKGKISETVTKKIELSKLTVKKQNEPY